MRSVNHFVFSFCGGVTLALASNVLLPPLLAVLVAMACVSTAWVLLRLDFRGLAPPGAGCDGLLRDRHAAQRRSADEWGRA